MIIFHEGLPGSGKSYESVVKHVLPALEKGRHVYARMDGFDDADCISKIAKVIGKPIEFVSSYLHHITEAQVPSIPSLVSENSLVLIDELQNHYPSGKTRLDDKISKFVTEHRHLGIDILCMGQDMRDCHALWKRRVDRKITFTKLDMIGADNRYKWAMHKAISGERFEQVSSGVQVYDKKYFGTYKSHVSDDVNTVNYEDKRSVFWRSGGFKWGLAFVVCAVYFGGDYLRKQFDPSTTSLYKHPVSGAVAPAVPVPASAPAVPVSARSVPVSAPAASAPSPALPADYVQGLQAAGGRVRLVTVMASPGRPPYVVIEFRDSSYRVTDRLDIYMLSDLGWSVDVKSMRLVRLYKKGSPDMIATAWPLEVVGEVSDRQNEGVRRSSKTDDVPVRATSPGALESPPAVPPGMPPASPGIVPQMMVSSSGGAAAINWTSARVP